MPQCPVCSARIQSDGVPCPHCGTLYHEACDPGYCVVPGCTPRPAAGVATPPPPARLPFSRFSLLELLLFIAMAAVTAAIAVPNFKAARERKGPRACYANQKTVVGAMEMYNLDKNTKRTQLDRGFFEALKSGGYLQSIPDHPGSGPGTWHNYRESSSGNGITCLICGPIQ